MKKTVFKNALLVTPESVTEGDLACSDGVLTGVGGGLLRDIMARQTPYILKKHVYACASIAGGICYSFLLSSPVNNDIAMITSAALVIAIRLLATHYCWNLPRALKQS